ncbi:5-oxoprolinase subunit PxpB [Lactobacillaceae bacterium L1_55_11]|nr:5-oxoprolinase subunit PxpB [Lactobacillaceae bacterium L1_55_11]
MTPKIIFSGDTSLNVVFDDQIDPAINNQVLAVAHQVQDWRLPGLVDIVPAYRVLTLIFDPLVTDGPALKERVAGLVANLDEAGETYVGRHFEIPVRYDTSRGLDLEEVAEHAGLSVQEVINLHTEARYRVYMLGFLPGFAYLGGLNPKLYTPRRSSPRLAVPAGSVGIAGKQTGFYPVTSPGGWQIVGQTPLALYDQATASAPFSAGDEITFKTISEDEFEALDGQPAVDYFAQATE